MQFDSNRSGKVCVNLTFFELSSTFFYYFPRISCYSTNVYIFFINRELLSTFFTANFCLNNKMYCKNDFPRNSYDSTYLYFLFFFSKISIRKKEAISFSKYCKIAL